MSAATSITWWGHATTTIALGHRRVLTDPVFTRRVAHLSRIGGPVPDGEALRADVAVVSHLHHDHLHIRSLRMLDPAVPIIVPRGGARALRATAPAIARRVHEMALGEVMDVGGVRVRAVPAVHDGRRSSMSRHRGTALGYALETVQVGVGGRVWFAGDTGLFDAMSELGPVHVAVVPIGGWGPSLGPTHLDPAQAAEAVRRVGAHDAVPVHYGTFWPTGLRHLRPVSFQRWFTDPAAAFVTALAVASPHAHAHVLRPGQTVSIACPGAASS